MAMGPRHTREQILAGALEVAVEDGLSRLTFGRVGRHLGISDRTVVYYVPTADALVTEVLAEVGARLQALLGDAFAAPADDHLGLARAAWPTLACAEVDWMFSLYFEASGLAAAGREPYRSLVAGLVEGWVAWLAGFVDGTPAHRRAEAEAALALIDGLLLLRQLAGAAAADRAAARLGLR
jgi:AcrR family transcriptional regulator